MTRHAATGDSGALRQSGIARFGADDARLASVASNPTLDVLMQHRTHRLFRDAELPESTISTVLSAAFSAPSKSDLQQVTAIRVRNADTRASIASLIPSMPWIGSCPAFFVFCADGARIEHVCARRGKPFANDNLDNFIAAVCDVGLVMQAFIVAAESLGLGCCPISVIRDHMATMIELLGLPPRVVPIAGMCTGHPAREGFVSMRLPLAVTVHEDRYDRSTLGAPIDDYDARRDARFSLPADRQRDVGRFGVAAFYGWSEDKARQMAIEERADVGHCVRGHGFALR